MEPIKDLRLAVLIDAENVPSTSIKGMLEEIAKYGTPAFKRIYADWTSPHVSRWKSALLENAITPIQQYSYTTGKNASDSAMIIDAMDILYSGRVNGFCLITSDSDFTRLATRLREAGMKVLGIGEKKTPVSFISACDKFIYIEILKKEQAHKSILSAPKKSKPSKKKTNKKSSAPIENTQPKNNNQNSTDTIDTIDKELVKSISDSVNDVADENGWAFLGELGDLIIKKQPDFDPRNYGFKKLLPLIKSLNRFEIDERETGKKNVKHVYLRAK
ncbi:MAG TPA: NYN domain-containing protein [Ignavibacteria bacterium]|nr:NYN domain-containing protein [Ignavibacteria bacterium]